MCKNRKMNPKINRKSNGAFTLVEIIGVMAIIGILGAVVAPRVIDGIKESRVTQLAQNLGQWKSGADRYLQKQQKFPDDGVTAATTQEGTPYVDPRTGNSVSAAQTTLGDWLLAQGLVSAINVQFGTQTDTRATVSGVSLTTPTSITGTTLSTFAQIRCSQETATSADTFTATQTRDVPHRVVYLAIPGVPLQEAAAIKNKIDGPFTNPAGGPLSDNALLGAAVAQSGTTSIVPQAQLEALNRGNCRVGADTANGSSTYKILIYITND
jgi:type II secretory pathway pseudopilin PulG